MGWRAVDGVIDELLHRLEDKLEALRLELHDRVVKFDDARCTVSHLSYPHPRSPSHLLQPPLLPLPIGSFLFVSCITATTTSSSSATLPLPVHVYSMAPSCDNDDDNDSMTR